MINPKFNHNEASTSSNGKDKNHIHAFLVTQQEQLKSIEITQDEMPTNFKPFYFISYQSHSKDNVFSKRYPKVKTFFRLFTNSLLWSPLTCLALFMEQGQAVLSAVSKKTIQGSAPYITFDGGKTKIKDTNNLLWLSFEDATGKTLTFNKEQNTSSAENPYIISDVIMTFADIKLPVPTEITTLDGQQSISIDDLIKPNNWGDEDGDQLMSTTGFLTAKFYDANSNPLKRSDKIDPCSRYYRIELYANNISIQTQYGSPRVAWFSDGGTTYYVQPNLSKPYACWAQPNLIMNGGKDNHNSYNGPKSEWKYDKGFLLQDINQPSKNFPTVGAHDLFFNLTIAGASAKHVNYKKQPSDSNISLDLSFTNPNDNIVKIKLVGPNENSTKAQAKVKPTIFTIYADKAKKVPIYSFEISKWFIFKAGPSEGYDATKRYCSNIGYRIPSVSEYTNGNSSSINNFWDSGLSNQPNNYQRRIGGGILSEWGVIYDYYRTKQFNTGAFWANESSIINDHYYDINDNGGFIGSKHGANALENQSVCVNS